MSNRAGNPDVGAVPEGWLPIETAPKDGAFIRVRYGKWAPWIARWNRRRWRPIEYSSGPNPTHWQPLYPEDQ